MRMVSPHQNRAVGCGRIERSSLPDQRRRNQVRQQMDSCFCESNLCILCFCESNLCTCFIRHTLSKYNYDFICAQARSHSHFVCLTSNSHVRVKVSKSLVNLGEQIDICEVAKADAQNCVVYFHCLCLDIL